MPRIIESVNVDLQEMDLDNLFIQDKREPPRPSGIHLSGILRYVLVSFHMPGWDRIVQDLDTEGPQAQKKVPLIWFMGIAFEKACCALYPDIEYKPGGLDLNGIKMTPDGRSLLMFEDNGDTRVENVWEEFKYTSRKRPEAYPFTDDWLKMQQGLGYCAGSGTDRIRLVRWHVLWNWRPWEPAYSRYLIEFSDKEVQDTADMLETNKAGAIAAGYTE